jgi:hypothetical protein
MTANTQKPEKCRLGVYTLLLSMASPVWIHLVVKTSTDLFMQARIILILESFFLILGCIAVVRIKTCKRNLRGMPQAIASIFIACLFILYIIVFLLLGANMVGPP